jgi:hypothetical protein
VQRGCVKNGVGAVQRGDSKGLGSDFDVGQLVGVVNEGILHKKLITCPELLNWETLVNCYIRQNGNGTTTLRKITQNLEEKEGELPEREEQVYTHVPHDEYYRLLRPIRPTCTADNLLLVGTSLGICTRD